MTEPLNIDTVVALAESRGLSHVHLGLFDSHGHLMVKRYHAGNLRKAMTEGIRWVAAILAAAPSGTDMVPSHPLADPERQFGDGTLRMDPSSCRAFPLDPEGDGLLLIGDFVDPATRRHCVRSLLGQQLEALGELGYEAVGALEMESVALAETPATLADKSADAVTFRSAYSRPYQLISDSEDLAYVDALNAVCRTMGVELDSQHPEFMHLLETSLRPVVGVRIADDAALYKNVAKVLARRRGFMMSFMARWHPRQQGCGAHLNVSLRHSASGEPAFYDADAANGVSDLQRWFVGGLQAHLPELFLLLAPNLNSYKRFAPGLFTPLNNTWGIDNKTVAYRALAQTPASARVEVRLAGADVSPHLGLLAVILAGRLGVAARREPSAPVEGSGWGLPDPPERAFELNFEGAIERFAGSALARRELGDTFVDGYVGAARWQLERFRGAVTDWELQNFADGA